jgi:hypothetical protein
MPPPVRTYRTSEMSALANQSLLRTRLYVLSFLISSLSVTVQLKLGEIQYLEIVLAADLLIVLWLFQRSHLRVRVFRPFLSIGASYAIFVTFAFLLSLLVLRFTHNPYTFSFLKRPVVVTLARIAELFLDVFYMLYMASLYRRDEALCAFGAKVYYWTGFAGCIYAIATFPLNYFFEMQLGTSTVSHRLRGFNNEGGSYGTYMVSVILLAVAMHHRGWLTRRQFRWGMALFLVNLVGSQSKGGFFVVVTITISHMIWTFSGIRRWFVLGGVFAAFTILAFAVDLPSQVDAYARASAMYQKLSNIKSQDGNFVLGRVAGAVLGPRMIMQHPLAGVGGGNYPLVRDDPDYRQGTAFIIGNLDAPGLGPIDYIVELGFPLWFYLTWVSLKPVYLLRRHRADPWLLSLAMMQPVSNWFGAHLNITYPWVVVGLALGMGFTERKAPAEEAEA